MGYRKPKRVYVLKFEEREGLEVDAHGASTGQLMKLMDLSELGDRRISRADITEINGLFELFASRLVSWNLEEEDGTPVPLTHAGLMDQEMDFVMELVFAWLDGVIGISAPLEPNSGDGKPFPEESIPMEFPLPSLVN